MSKLQQQNRSCHGSSAPRRWNRSGMLIAGTAVGHGLVVATRNTRDFQGCGVRVFNPFARRQGR